MYSRKEQDKRSLELSREIAIQENRDEKVKYQLLKKQLNRKRDSEILDSIEGGIRRKELEEVYNRLKKLTEVRNEEKKKMGKLLKEVERQRMGSDIHARMKAQEVEYEKFQHEKKKALHLQARILKEHRDIDPTELKEMVYRSLREDKLLTVHKVTGQRPKIVLKPPPKPPKEVIKNTRKPTNRRSKQGKGIKTVAANTPVLRESLENHQLQPPTKISDYSPIMQTLDSRVPLISHRELGKKDYLKTKMLYKSSPHSPQVYETITKIHSPREPQPILPLINTGKNNRNINNPMNDLRSKSHTPRKSYALGSNLHNKSMDTSFQTKVITASPKMPSINEVDQQEILRKLLERKKESDEISVHKRSKLQRKSTLRGGDDKTTMMSLNMSFDHGSSSTKIHQQSGILRSFDSEEDNYSSTRLKIKKRDTDNLLMDFVPTISTIAKCQVLPKELVNWIQEETHRTNESEYDPNISKLPEINVYSHTKPTKPKREIIFDVEPTFESMGNIDEMLTTHSVLTKNIRPYRKKRDNHDKNDDYGGERIRITKRDIKQARQLAEYHEIKTDDYMGFRQNKDYLIKKKKELRSKIYYKKRILEDFTPLIDENKKAEIDIKKMRDRNQKARKAFKFVSLGQIANQEQPIHL